MKFTLSWLREHLESDASLNDIANTLTKIGLELEEIIDRSAALKQFTVGHVISARPHPNADRLQICTVDNGIGKVQVICGAPNARPGIKAVFAAAGSTIPGTGLQLKTSLIRGEESNGMLCSEKEMGLSENHEGIIELPEDSQIGIPFSGVLGLDDPIININVTPNRQDCLGVRGVARDLAAAGLGRLRPFKQMENKGKFQSPISVFIDFPPEMEDACPYFVGRYFRDIKNGPSPSWLQKRLLSIGLRPISALVDITNYITYDLSRPLHVFDANKIRGAITVRSAAAGESLKCLDGKIYSLGAGMTVISDELGAEALGGVMGGEKTGCTDETVNVFLEAALFDPKRTARTGRNLGIESDARYRFERGIDPDMLIPGLEYATQLILQICGGEASELIKVGSPGSPPSSIKFRPAKVSNLAGISVQEDEQLTILFSLGFTVNSKNEVWDITPPSWRTDVHGEADIVEEISRIAGFERISTAILPRPTKVAIPALTKRQRKVPFVKRALASQGMLECVTWSFMSRRFAQLFGGGSDELILSNPISSELDAMRPTILGNLILAARRNKSRGFSDLAFFEVGPTYVDSTPNGQTTVAGGIRMGFSTPRNWSKEQLIVNAFDAKTDALAALQAISAPVKSIQIIASGPEWYHPGRVGTICLGPKTILAWFGEIHPKILRVMDIEGPIVGFEVLIDNSPGKNDPATTRRKLVVSDYPAVQRDFAFVVDETVEAGAVIKAARNADKNLITDVSVFDVYKGENIEKNKKSIAISVRLEPQDRTLTDPEIEGVVNLVQESVSKATGAAVRR